MMRCKVNFKVNLGLGTLRSPRDTRINEPQKQTVRVFRRGKKYEEKKTEKNHMSEKDKLTLESRTYSPSLYSGKHLGET